MARTSEEDYSPFIPFKAPSNSKTNFLYLEGNDVGQKKKLDLVEKWDRGV